MTSEEKNAKLQKAHVLLMNAYDLVEEVMEDGEPRDELLGKLDSVIDDLEVDMGVVLYDNDPNWRNDGKTRVIF